MKLYKIIPAILLLLGLQEMPLAARTIPFTVDAAQFRYDSVRTLWEMYYSFPDTSLQYIPAGDSYLGELYIKTVIYSATDTVAFQEWIVSNRRDSANPVLFKNLVGQKLFAVKPGQYTVSLHIQDVNDAVSQADSKFPLLVKDFSKATLGISDLEIASSIEMNTADSPFKKGSVTVVPNPSKEYISTEPSVLTYAEVYNAAGDFKVRYRVLDGAKRDVFSVERVRKAAADATVEIMTLPAELLPSGTYFAELMVTSPSVDPVDSSIVTKKFYILNPSMPPEANAFFSEDELFLRSEFSTMSDDKIKQEFEQAQYIATPQDIAAYNSLTDSKAKQKFLYRFWAARDSDTSTVANETLDEYRKQITYASTFYSNIQVKDGWKTDRGRVRLKYGAPSEVNRQDFHVGGKPYEIWSYNNIQGGNVVFCFVDLNGYNNYKLVHSTAIGEVRDDRWKERYVDANNFNPNGDLR